MYLIALGLSFFAIMCDPTLLPANTATMHAIQVDHWGCAAVARWDMKAEVAEKLTTMEDVAAAIFGSRPSM